MAVIRNPFAGQFVEDLRPLFEAGAMLGERLMPELVKLLDGPAVSYGKGGGAAIDADDLGDVWPFVAGANTNFDGLSRLHAGDAALSQHALVEEASPDPSESSTNPKPLSGLNHLTTPWTGGPEGASNR